MEFAALVFLLIFFGLIILSLSQVFAESREHDAPEHLGAPEGDQVNFRKDRDAA